MTDGTALADQPEEEAPEEHVGRWEAPRLAVVDIMRTRLTAKLQDVEGGPFDGVRVVTAKDLEDALAEPLPPASLFAAEVRTPAWVTVAAVCPQCGIPTDVALNVNAELLVDVGAREIRLKGKSKPRSHVCGQTTLADAAEQGTFDLSDIIGQPATEEAADDGDAGPA